MKIIFPFLLFLALAPTTTVAQELPTAASKKIVRITKKGFEPKQIKLTKNDATVFFFNETGQAIEDFSIDFGRNRIHCHNPSLYLDSDGYLRNNQPIVPNSFVLACFPDARNYQVRSKLGSETLKGSVLVPEAKKES